jgi:hypothetical protein
LRDARDAEANAAYTIPESKPTKFSKYVEPGGENYREILLTLPFKEPVMPKGYEITSVQYDDGSFRYFANTPTTRSSAYKTEAEAQSELQRMSEGLKDFRASQASFRSSHFEQPNILAHMRVNDRVVDGKKTLFIEEVQSDWHQAGRKQGYGPQTETTHEAYYTTPDGQKVSLGFGATQEEAAAAVDSGWKGLVDVKFDSQTKKVGEGVPDAPFKTTWHELALKRAIQEASEKGYDKIAFTVGKTQVNRYPEELRKVADEIKWYSMNDKERSVIVSKQGNRVFGATVDENGVITQSPQKEAIGKNIEEVIGKPMGQKVVGELEGTIAGEEFTVGGKGMEGFYDNILPKSLNNLGKKFDAKVTKTKMKAGQDVTEPGISAPGIGMEFSGKTIPAPEVEVWTMDITPKMRESVTTKGQPLFQFAPAVPAAGLLDYEER